jgi:hypothetical protein
MKNAYQEGTIYTTNCAFRQFGGLTRQETGGNSVTIDLQFRMATNGIIVNTHVNGEPLITTSAGKFNK